MKVWISLDNQGYKDKPKNNIALLKTRISKRWQEIELEKLADLVGNKGYAVIPGYMVTGFKAIDCAAMQVFMLDFDSGVSFDEINMKCEKMQLPIAFAYHTYSSTEKAEKFRIAFVFEYLIKERFIIEIIIEMLYRLFPECDRQCKNLDRMFLGGKRLIYYDETARFPMVQLYFSFLKSLDVEDHHFSDRVKRFANKHKILLINGNLAMGRLQDKDAIFGETLDSTVNIYIVESKFSPFFIAEGGKKTEHRGETCKKRKKRKLKIQIDNCNCQLYKDFQKGIELTHDAKFAIMTNLLAIQGGIGKFLEKIKEVYGEESFKKWKKDIKYVEHYKPKKCDSSFCPYYDVCTTVGTIIDTLERNRQIYQEKEDLKSIGDAEHCLQKNLEEAFLSDCDGLHLIKAQTGLGKTKAYIDLIKKYPNCMFLVAVPTNRLKEEIKTKLLQIGISEESIYMTASVHGNSLIPLDIQEQISNAHQRGMHGKTKRIISDYYNEIKEDTNKKAVAKECEQILKGINGIKNERVIITTHAYLSLMQKEFLSNYTIIIDEDFLQLQVFTRINSISISCLSELAEKDIPFYSKLADEMLRTKVGEYKKIEFTEYASPLLESQLKELEYFGVNDNINDLIDAKTYVKVKDIDSKEEIIKYFCPLFIPTMKYIVLSATFNEKIYRLYFKEHLMVYTYPEKKAAYQGKLVQYTYHSLGRKDLSKKLEVFSVAQEKLKESKPEVISFKNNRILPKNMDGLNSAGIHFGNSTGLNSLAGKNIAIIGTPYKTEEYYKLIACYLGVDVNLSSNRRPSFRRVKYKKANFLITTYKDEILREIQLYSLESELEQCVGRARLLRNHCTVYLYSAFPCEQAEIHIENYLI